MTIAAARADLYALLAAAGLPMVEPSGGMTPPCVFLVPGSTFVEPSSLGQKLRLVRFDIVGAVGSASDPAVVSAVDAMAEALSTALVTYSGSAAYQWSMPSLGAPTAYDIGGASYLAIRGTVEAHITS